MKRQPKDDLFLLAVAGSVVLLDQLSKYLVHVYLPPGQVFMPDAWLTRYARIVHMHNTGAAAGIFPGGNLVFAFLAALASLAIIYYYPHAAAHGPLTRLGMALILGGALGNLIDRILQGHVTDFISLGGLPAGNIADISLLLGVVLLIISLGKK